MKVPNNIGNILLAIYLILVGLSGTFGFDLGQAGIVVPLLAIGAGVLMLLGKP